MNLYAESIHKEFFVTLLQEQKMQFESWIIYSIEKWKRSFSKKRVMDQQQNHKKKRR